MPIRLTCAVLAACALVAACGDDSSPASDGGAAAGPRTIATGLSVPWSIAFLPGGDALVSERDTARILRVTPGGRKRVVMRVPGVAPGGEGGLLGLAVSPRYRRDRLVYAYFTSATDNRIVRFRLGGKPRSVVTGLRKGAEPQRRAASPSGPTASSTPAWERPGTPRTAQDLGSQNGKILRMNPNGSRAAGQPVPRLAASGRYGHRNVQGLAWDRRGRLWASELGAGHLRRGEPDQEGQQLRLAGGGGRGSTRGGRFTNPKITWPTSEASPSGAAIAGRTLYIGALRGERFSASGSPARGRGSSPRSAVELRPDPGRGPRSGRLHLDLHVEPGWARKPPLGRRPHSAPRLAPAVPGDQPPVGRRTPASASSRRGAGRRRTGSSGPWLLLSRRPNQRKSLIP